MVLSIKKFNEDSVIYRIYPGWAEPFAFLYYFSLDIKQLFNDFTNFIDYIHNNLNTISTLKVKFNRKVNL